MTTAKEAFAAFTLDADRATSWPVVRDYLLAQVEREVQSDGSLEHALELYDKMEVRAMCAEEKLTKVTDIWMRWWEGREQECGDLTHYRSLAATLAMGAVIGPPEAQKDCAESAAMFEGHARSEAPLSQVVKECDAARDELGVVVMVAALGPGESLAEPHPGAAVAAALALRTRAEEAEWRLDLARGERDALRSRLIPEEERRKLTGDTLLVEGQLATLRSYAKKAWDQLATLPGEQRGRGAVASALELLAASLDEPAEPSAEPRCTDRDDGDFTARVEAIVAPLIAAAERRAVVEALERVRWVRRSGQPWADELEAEIARARRGDEVVGNATAVPAQTPVKNDGRNHPGPGPSHMPRHDYPPGFEEAGARRGEAGG